MTALLELRNVDARYGPVKALHGVSLEVGEGELVAVLGANGAGKTTTLRAGIAHVPEGRRTFSELSVWDNLRLGSYLRWSGAKEEAKRVYKFFPRLEERRDQQAGTLSGGEQQMLALGRAMMSRPRMLLLDEPSLGLAPIVVNFIFDALERMRQQEGLSVLVVEQNAGLALAHATRAYVLEVGRVVVHGTSDELQQNESVRKSYLGY
jgi:branched-chain amino acid transport system ATP-binding protein